MPNKYSVVLLCKNKTWKDLLYIMSSINNEIEYFFTSFNVPSENISLKISKKKTDFLV